jgi:hypothetical protein
MRSFLSLVSLVQHNHPKILSISLSHTTVGAVTYGVAGAPTFPALTLHYFFLRFGGGRPLHTLEPYLPSGRRVPPGRSYLLHVTYVLQDVICMKGK